MRIILISARGSTKNSVRDEPIIKLINELETEMKALDNAYPYDMPEQCKRMRTQLVCQRDALLGKKKRPEATDVTNTTKPVRIITMSGSNRFKEDHLREMKRLALEGNIVIGCPFFSQSDKADQVTEEQSKLLAELHKKKIDISDQLFVINKDGYIGESTADEINYAQSIDCPVKYMVDPVSENDNPGNPAETDPRLVAVIGEDQHSHIIDLVAARLEAFGYVTMTDHLTDATRMSPATLHKCIEHRKFDESARMGRYELASAVYIVTGCDKIPNNGAIAYDIARITALGKPIIYVRGADDVWP